MAFVNNTFPFLLSATEGGSVLLSNLKRVSPLAMYVWQIRLILFMFIPAFFLFFFYQPQSLAWKLCAAAVVAGFVIMAVVWLPIKYLKLAYQLDGKTLYVRWGVIYTRYGAAFLENIQYVTMSATPLQRLFRLCNVNFVLAGGRMAIPCVGREEGELLRLWGCSQEPSL